VIRLERRDQITGASRPASARSGAAGRGRRLASRLKIVELVGETETRTLTGRRRTNVARLTDHLNAPVQGTGADGLKLALALLSERRGECPGAVPVLVCHDEVVVECDADKAEEGKEWLVQAMKDGMDAVVNAKEPRTLIEVEASVTKTWGG
jgi:DNA polymerase-1